MRVRRPTGDAIVDPALQQKKRARHRLVGALALSLLAVIVIPLVLQSEPRLDKRSVPLRAATGEGQLADASGATRAAGGPSGRPASVNDVPPRSSASNAPYSPYLPPDEAAGSGQGSARGQASVGNGAVASVDASPAGAVASSPAFSSTSAVAAASGSAAAAAVAAARKRREGPQGRTSEAGRAADAAGLVDPVGRPDAAARAETARIEAARRAEAARELEARRRADAAAAARRGGDGVRRGPNDPIADIVRRNERSTSSSHGSSPDAPARSTAAVAAGVAAAGGASSGSSAGVSAGAGAAATSDASRRFLVQVGAFGNAGSATAMTERVARAGLTARQEPVRTTGGQIIRVQVGPFASREAAERAQVQLRKAGVTAAIVSL